MEETELTAQYIVEEEMGLNILISLSKELSAEKSIDLTAKIIFAIMLKLKESAQDKRIICKIFPTDLYDIERLFNIPRKTTIKAIKSLERNGFINAIKHKLSSEYSIYQINNKAFYLSVINKNKSQQIEHGKQLVYLKSLPYQEYLKTEHWDYIRKLTLKNANYRCSICNNAKPLHTHHRSYEYSGEEEKHMEDIICLCNRCHYKFHFQLPKPPEEVLTEIPTIR